MLLPHVSSGGQAVDVLLTNMDMPLVIAEDKGANIAHRDAVLNKT